MKLLRILTLLNFLYIVFPQSEASPLSDNVTRVLNDLLKKPYDKRVRPLLGENALFVRIGVFLDSLLHVNEKNSEASLKMTFKQSWLEPRLTFLPGVVPNDTIQLGPDQTRFLWMPDTVFGNQGHLQKLDGHESTFLNFEGLISTSVKVSLTFDCVMALDYFPFDTHTCSVNFISYAHERRDITYEWMPQESLLENVNLEFHIKKFKLISIETKSSTPTTKLGYSSLLQLKFHFRRIWETYWIKAFFPMFAFTSISLSSLWFTVTTPKLSMLLNFFNIALYILYAGILLGESVESNAFSGTLLSQYWTISITFIFLTFVALGLKIFLEKESPNGKRPGKSGEHAEDEEEPRGQNDIEMRNTSSLTPWEEPSRRTFMMQDLAKYVEPTRKGLSRFEPHLKWILAVGFLLANMLYFGIHINSHHNHIGELEIAARF